MNRDGTSDGAVERTRSDPSEQQDAQAAVRNDDDAASDAFHGEHGANEGELADQMTDSSATLPPPLPPRPKNLDPMDDRPPQTGSLRLSRRGSRPHLLSSATTAVSLTDVHTRGRGDHASVTSSPASRAVSRKHSYTHFGRFVGTSATSETDDSASTKSRIPTLEVGVDFESLVGDVPEGVNTPAWRSLSAQVERENPFDYISLDDDVDSLQIQQEFDDVSQLETEHASEEALLTVWRAKLKHFFILSASGKPIYSRHGDDRLIGHYIGIIQTIISFYQEAHDPLRYFTAGTTRFVVLPKGNLNLVAISRLGESEAQLRIQLEALYMQILSTLTLPSMDRMFSSRPSTDLRRPLEGTDILLDGLTDGFTRGSPSTLLSALECLRLRKTHRQTIDNSLLKVRATTLLYGLIVADGRLVSVVRPKKHSLHPGDLQLIFNMLFEAGSVKAAGGENWIPLCLPGFNNTGYLYMYVSFVSASSFSAEGATAAAPSSEDERPKSAGKDDELAIVLISASREAFYDLRQMRNDLLAQLKQNGSLNVLASAIQRGRAPCSIVVPGTPLLHFLYKSKGNVQFAMPSFSPHFQGLVARRRLMSLYHELHESMHSRTAHLKVQHVVGGSATAIAWETPLFELYCVAGPSTQRSELAQGANRVVQWIRREEERIFIIGGAVF